MSDDPFRDITDLALHRRHSVEYVRGGWVVRADPTIALLWVTALGVGGLGLLLVGLVSRASGAVLIALAVLLLLASWAYHLWEERTARLELLPDGFRIANDRLRWSEVASFEAVPIDVTGLNASVLLEISGLLVLLRDDSRLCFPTRASLDDVQAVVARLEKMWALADGPLPEEASRVSALVREAEP